MYLKYQTEKITLIMFEHFNVKSLYIANPAVLSLFSAGKFNGIVYEYGDRLTQTVPIYDGYSLPHSINQLDQLEEI